MNERIENWLINWLFAWIDLAQALIVILTFNLYYPGWEMAVRTKWVVYKCRKAKQ